MFTHKDIEMRSIFVVNCIQHDRSLRVNSGELMLEEIEGDKKKTLTKFPFQKLLALFIIGHITVTTPLIDKCKKEIEKKDKQMRKVWSCNRCYETKLTSRFLLG